MGSTLFNDFSRFHHRNTVAQSRYYTKIMCDNQHRYP